MKYSLLFLITIAFCATACATVHSWPPSAYKPTEESKTPTKAEARILYQQYYVAKTDGMLSQIDYEDYSGRATAKYFEKSGAIEAADMANEAVALEHRGKKWEIGTLIGGVAVGVATALVLFDQDTKDANPGCSTCYAIPALLYIVAGGAAGFGVGGGLGWSIYHAHYRPKAEEIFSEASNSFNQYIAGKLNISISPMPGGAAGAIKFTY